MEKIFAAHGLRLFDVEEIKPQGGSLRIYACHEDDATHPTGPRVPTASSRSITPPPTTSPSSAPRRWPTASPTLEAIIDVLERNRRYLNLAPKCEPQLGKRGLYAAIGGRSDTRDRQMAMLWVLNQSDGGPDLLAIAERAGLPFALVADAAETLAAHDLLAPA